MEEIEVIEKANIDPEDVEDIRAYDNRVILREKGRNGMYHNLTTRSAMYDTVSTHTISPLQKKKTYER